MRSMSKWGTIVAALVFGLVTISVTPVQAANGYVKADKIVVLKSKRKMVLFHRGAVMASYRIWLGPNPAGHKAMEGDGRTPEGTYVIDRRRDNSRFYRALGISYPNARDRAKAARLGVRPGGQIMIHGTPSSEVELIAARALGDWTNGCIAVENHEMEEIWRRVDIGTVIEIRP